MHLLTGNWNVRNDSILNLKKDIDTVSFIIRDFNSNSMILFVNSYKTFSDLEITLKRKK